MWQKNPKAPVDILERLADDDMIYVRVEVAKNPGTPPNLLLKMLDDDRGQKYESFSPT